MSELTNCKDEITRPIIDTMVRFRTRHAHFNLARATVATTVFGHRFGFVCCVGRRKSGMV